MVRVGQVDEACDLCVRELLSGTAQAGAVWDAVHLLAGELVLSSKPFRPNQQTNGDALHANTAANALHFAFRSSMDSKTRLMLCLQAVAWMALYRGLSRKKDLLLPDHDILALCATQLPDKPAAVIDAILATRTTQPHEAARLAFAFAQRGPIGPLLQAARRLLIVKASGDPHDIKFPVAVLEDLDIVSPVWRPNLLAAATFSFWGSDRTDSESMTRVRDAFK